MLEVMLAAVVLVFGITTSIVTLQRGFQALDTARNFTLASQVMQSEMERLRLKSWAQIQALQDSNERTVNLGTTAVGTTGLTCTRSISDLKTDMKEIVVISTWHGYDSRSHTLRFITRYSKSGLYDYLYTAH